MVVNVIKIQQNEVEDTFTYRDEYNDEKVVRFPRNWEMTEQEVENWLNS